jgi:hypothetical protein
VKKRKKKKIDINQMHTQSTEVSNRNTTSFLTNKLRNHSLHTVSAFSDSFLSFHFYQLIQKYQSCTIALCSLKTTKMQLFCCFNQGKSETQSQFFGF